MSETCNHQCDSCNQDCESRSFLEKPHEMSQIKKVIGVVSGKGGVGKSMVTSLLAVTMRRLGHLQCDFRRGLTGPSIPKSFGIKSTGHVGRKRAFAVGARRESTLCR